MQHSQRVLLSVHLPSQHRHLQHSTNAHFSSEILITTFTSEEGWSLVLQGSRNKFMHISNGNTRLILQQTGDNLFGSLQLNLFDLLHANPLAVSQPQVDVTCTYSRGKLLSLRPQPNNLTVPLFQTTTQFHCSAVSADHSKRTGRRRKIFLSNGVVVFRKSPKNKVTPQIRNSSNSSQRRPPPPRGAPGAPQRSHEECPNLQGAQDLAKGAIRRNAQRRAYRRWRSQVNKDKAKGLDPPCPAPCRSKNAAQTRANWFRHSLLARETQEEEE